MAATSLHTEGNAVPPLDADLEEKLAALRGIHPALDLAADALRTLLLDRLTLDTTQTSIAALGGWEDNLIALIGAAIQRLSDPDTNPCLRTLPLDQQKRIQHAGQKTAYWHADPDLAQTASETSAAITGN
jgi:hypothetical protein